MVISICPEALTYLRRDTPRTSMIVSSIRWTVISSRTGSDRGGPDERGGRAVLGRPPGGGPPCGVSGRALMPTLGYLRRLGVAPPHTAVSPATPLDVLMAEYRHYLEGERGLSAGTVTHYLRCARVFLTWLPEPVGQSLPALSAGQVTDYVLGWTAGRGGGAAVDTVTLPALRSLLRFPARRGTCSVVAGGSGSGWSASARERGRAAGGVECSRPDRPGRLRPRQRGRPPRLRDPADDGPAGAARRGSRPPAAGRDQLAGG